MERRFFNPESGVWKPLGFVGDLVVLSLLWCLCSVPLVTLGPATAALYDTVVHSMRHKEAPPFYRFFDTFRRELKEGVLLTLLWIALFALAALGLYAAMRLFPGFAARWSLVILAALLIAFFMLCVLCWVFPTLSRFTLPIPALQRNALRLALGHILRSAAMALLWSAALYLSLRYVAPLFVLPGAVTLLCSCLIEPVFRPFEEPREEKE